MRRARGLRTVNESDRVAERPAALDREGVDTVQEVEVVLDGLARQSAALLREQIARDSRGVDLLPRALAEVRRPVLAQVAAVVGDRRALALHHVLEVVDVGRAGLLDRPALGAGDDLLCLHAPAQLALGLHARQPVGGPRPALPAELAFDPRRSGPPFAVAGLAATIGIRAHVEPAGSVGAFAHTANSGPEAEFPPRRIWRPNGASRRRTTAPRTGRSPDPSGAISGPLQDFRASLGSGLRE